MENSAVETKKKKYLTFSIGVEFYGTGIEQVREIIRFDQLTKVHDSMEYIRGVINLRGKIIPIMDLRLKLSLPFLEYTDKTVLIIMEIEGQKGTYLMGLAVDAVHEVINPEQQDLEEIPSLGLKMKRDYLQGIIKSGNEMVMILDMNRIVTEEDIISLKASAE